MTRDFYEGITQAITSKMIKNHNDNDDNQTNHDNGNNCNNSNNRDNGDNHDKPNIVGHSVVFFLTVLHRQLCYVYLFLLFVNFLCICTFTHFIKSYCIKVGKYVQCKILVNTVRCGNKSICRFVNAYIRKNYQIYTYITIYID